MTNSPAPARSLPRWSLHLIAISITVLVAFVAVLGLDIYVHQRLRPYAAVNIWGYRGDVLGRKRANEKRILMIGPSTVFSVGFPPEQSLPAHLERSLQRRVAFPVHVVNLGMPGEDVYAYRANLEDFGFLKPDAVIFYGDSNPTGYVVPVVQRRNSPVFRLTGYYPILHIAIREKALMMRHAGKIESAYGAGKVVFRPAAAQSAGADPLKAAADVADYVKSAVGAAAETPATPNDFKDYCRAWNSAVSYARSLGLPTLVVNQPYETAFQIRIQQALQAMLREQFGRDDGVRYLDLGNAIDLKDPGLAYDGVHLTPAGNAHMAERLVDAARALLERPVSPAR
ncbi:MAG: SGNH/GDSL hydrolase family protein [Cyanobacteria bacterium]|nr:SGNH/GDSL hydrolase family protein [Cyanobacteriota bacterium]